MRLGTRQECVKSLSRVSGACQDDAREFASRRPRLAGRLLRVAEKLIGRLTMIGAMKLQRDDGPRSSLGIKSSSDDAVGSRHECARRFTEGIVKLAENMPGDRWKKTKKLTARMLEATGLAEVRS
ncbi:hypothetical protein B296_00021408 [Ensete ventricosum]|uniref:Uncharacterized protein n=1 Tax=Ensete ventricosum TaxID=4639 RepID=A0A426ZLU6_ENSVE|nr:hypothetical protein B296_00021408 [Ensete ventricosum]